MLQEFPVGVAQCHESDGSPCLQERGCGRRISNLGQQSCQRSVSAFVFHHPARVAEFEYTAAQSVRSLRVLPAKIGHRHLYLEIGEMRDPAGCADNQRALAKEKSFQDLRSVDALPTGACLLASEVKT